MFFVIKKTELTFNLFTFNMTQNYIFDRVFVKIQFFFEGLSVLLSFWNKIN